MNLREPGIRKITEYPASAGNRKEPVLGPPHQLHRYIESAMDICQCRDVIQVETLEQSH